jgi:thioesterase domain-containing protein
VLEMFCCLLSGGTAVLADTDTRLSPHRLGTLLRERRVSFSCLPPAVLGLLADQDFPDLRLLVSGGDALLPELARAWLRDGQRLVNAYGPTEAAVVSLSCEVDGKSWPVPIGLPMPNYQAYVLDQQLSPVPVGVIGELHIGGASVARGYLNRPELTAERFVDDPFSLEPGARLYRTGDLVKRLPDGRIVFIGRADGQVKIRGLRIELGEIENALSRHPAVEQAVVQLEQSDAGEKLLTGYLRSTPSVREPDAVELADFLGRWLPGYMIPTQLVWLDRFPLNNSGKVDRKALSIVVGGRAATTATGAAQPQEPATRTEAVLVDIYADLLRRDRCGVLDSFFDAGGNSLQAMQLVSRVRAELGVDLPVTAVFLAPDVRGLAARIDDEQAGHAQPTSRGPVVLLADGGGTEPLFLVHAVGGTVLPYTQLAAELSDRYQVFGIQSPTLLDACAPVAGTLAELATRYLAELRRIQPTGPYRVGGWSMGGLLAHELAYQLEEVGAVVDLVVLLDAPFAIAADSSTDSGLARQFVADALRTLGERASEQPDSDEIEDQLAYLVEVLDPAARNGCATLDEVRRRLAVFSHHRRLMAGHRPTRRLHAASLLVSARQSPNEAVQNDWAGIIDGNVDRASYDTDHYGLLQPPHIRDIAARVLAPSRVG